ncbi:peptidylprolyl isomerase [Aliikangiella coralliicola]|uniref:Peptidyl-prolyl cis-trans isomerase n=1 Tax=Aliikangiella coralliicola TaxID=2592383 RepID=A0A545UJF1_9GAMM|nr:peptidylprolyl isomerase [Aliikangiella coralliicola]TQV89594.1 peptidylprolyl isomerase [Aliikangiella coralliicola]
MKSLKRQIIGLALSLSAAIFSTLSQATIVQFETALGNFEVNLYDTRTPQTVANFLQYVNAGDYSNAIIHRSVSNFVIQGGGFEYDNAWPVTAINANAAVTNEPVFSNVRGTIAMAKLSGNPNSATNQWFFNLTNNSQNLDRENSGFTVFGEVTGNGMAIIDQIAALDKYNFSGANAALGELPLQNYTGSGDPDNSNLVIITNITVIDAATDTAASLNPPLNIGPATPPTEPTSSGGGGAINALLLGLFVLLIVGRRRS